MPRLPLAPPLLPGEALSSWIARIAARYDLTADALVQYLLPNNVEPQSTALAIDGRPWLQLELALAEAAGQLEMEFAACRFPGVVTHPEVAWSRGFPCWCPVCLFEDVAKHGEVHARSSWGLGVILLCTFHGCLLVAECPCCFAHATYSPVNGRLRLWCTQCRKPVDDVQEPSHVPLWPFGMPQQMGRCRPVTLTYDARGLLLQVQKTRLAALNGQHVPAPWTQQLNRRQITATLRTLCFIMLGPLWEDNNRPYPVERTAGGPWRLPHDWSPGVLPPFIAATALLMAVTFLASENGLHLNGLTWNRSALLDGEKPEITVETLPWHLCRDDARVAQKLLRPGSEAFAMLLSILKADSCGIAATREERRRQSGVGALEAQRRMTAQSRRHESSWSRQARQRREQARPATDRYRLRVLRPDLDPPPPQVISARCEAAVAVYSVFGTDNPEQDIVHRSGWRGTAMECRYVQCWIIQHRDCRAEDLVDAATKAADEARTAFRGLLLREVATPRLVPTSLGR